MSTKISDKKKELGNSFFNDTHLNFGFCSVSIIIFKALKDILFLLQKWDKKENVDD
jgi:hypothetical protein